MTGTGFVPAPPNHETFHDLIYKRCPILFKQQQTKCRKKHHAKDIIRVNRGILGKLLSISIVQSNRFPNYFNVSISVSTKLDFSRREKRSTAKSKLLHIILPTWIPDSGDRTCNTLIVDTISLYRTTTKGKSKTFEQLIVKTKRPHPC